MHFVFCIFKSNSTFWKIIMLSHHLKLCMCEVLGVMICFPSQNKDNVASVVDVNVVDIFLRYV